MHNQISKSSFAYIRMGLLSMVLTIWPGGPGVMWATTTRQTQAQAVESLGPAPDSNYEAFNDDTFAADSPFRAAASVVGMILLKLDDEPRPFCSGLLISTKYVLTGRHCLQRKIANTDEWESLKPQQIIFEIDYFKYGAAAKMYPLKLVPVELGTGDLDFAILEAVNDIPIENRKIPLPGPDPTPKQDLYVIHYPGGETLKITRRECRAAERPEDGDFFRHVCDTEPGSSGAPVFNMNFQLIGIHTFSGKGQGGTSSSNGGILLSKIIGESSIVRTALEHNVSTFVATSTAAKPPVTARFKLANGITFARSEQGWRLLQKVESATKGSPLLEQRSSGDAFLLWDPSADVLYLVPKTGGDVKRKEGGEISWTSIGTVAKR